MVVNDIDKRQVRKKVFFYASKNQDTWFCWDHFPITISCCRIDTDYWSFTKACTRPVNHLMNPYFFGVAVNLISCDRYIRSQPTTYVLRWITHSASKIQNWMCNNFLDYSPRLIVDVHFYESNNRDATPLQNKYPHFQRQIFSLPKYIISTRERVCLKLVNLQPKISPAPSQYPKRPEFNSSRFKSKWNSKCQLLGCLLFAILTITAICNQSLIA